MDIQYDMTVELTAEDIKRILAQHVSGVIGGKFTVDANEIEFDVSEQLEGYGPAEHPVVRFRGASVKAKPRGEGSVYLDR